ncbi:MAG: hypothetical protein LBB34_01895 [Holosporales bacterium]|jgi:hypothetical protein|nr:hypothetical protein [Holosporales bacterium]
MDSTTIKRYAEKFEILMRKFRISLCEFLKHKSLSQKGTEFDLIFVPIRGYIKHFNYLKSQ